MQARQICWAMRAVEPSIHALNGWPSSPGQLFAMLKQPGPGRWPETALLVHPLAWQLKALEA
ncbi:MAG: hypothetical protein ACM32O_14100 [Clostridia bacterium]